MRMNKKKSSLALALVALLTVVGSAWAANLAWPGTLHVFDYSNTYSTGISGTTTGGATDYFSVTATLIPTADYNTPGEALAAGVPAGALQKARSRGRCAGGAGTIK